MEGRIIGVFGTNKELKTGFETSIAKQSEVEGMVVYHRNEGGLRLSLLDDPQFPERVQGYSRIASISDYACYLYPPDGRLSAPDGELAVLLESFELPGRVVIIGGGAGPDDVKASFRGLRLSSYPIEQRSRQSSLLDLTGIPLEVPRSSPTGALVYVDRAFSVRGVGTVVLGFVLSGRVSVHDTLRPIPSSSPSGRAIEVKGIQVNDEDQESVGRGVRVGLSLKGAEAKDLDRTPWLDDGSFSLTQKLTFEFAPSAYYKQTIEGRDLHLQLPGATVLANIARGDASRNNQYTAALPFEVPSWPGMRLAVLDLNGRNLRVTGGASVA